MVNGKEIIRNFLVGYVATKMVGIVAFYFAIQGGSELVTGVNLWKSILMPNTMAVALGVGVVVATPVVDWIMKKIGK